MMLVVIVLVIEYIGDVYVVNIVMGKDYVKDFGLYCILLGDGLVCFCVGLLGGFFVIIYLEVIGVMLFIKVMNF